MTQSPNQSEIVLYTTPDGTVKIDTVFQNETIWLTQKKMAELFDVQRPAITKHLKNIFESGELAERIRLDCESEANHNLNRLLDKPGLSYRKYLFGNMPG